MSQSYNVDDILAEIRQKKAQAASSYGAPDVPPLPEETGEQELPPVRRPQQARRPFPEPDLPEMEEEPAYNSGWENPRQKQPKYPQYTPPLSPQQPPAEPPRRASARPAPAPQPRRYDVPGGSGAKQPPQPRQPRRPDPVPRQETAPQKQEKPSRRQAPQETAVFNKAGSRQKPETRQGRQQAAYPSREAPSYWQNPEDVAEDFPQGTEAYGGQDYSTPLYGPQNQNQNQSYAAPSYGAQNGMTQDPAPQGYGAQNYSQPNYRAQSPVTGPENRAPYGDNNYYGDGQYAQEPPQRMNRFEDDEPPVRQDLPNDSTRTGDFAVHFDFDQDETAERPPYPGGASQEEEPEILARSQWHQSFLEQEMMEQPVPDDDFAVPEDAPYVEKDLKKQAVGLFVRSVIMVVLTLAASYLVFSIKRPPFADLIGLEKDELLGLPFEIIYPDLHPRIFMGVLLGLCVIGALACSNIIGTGFGALFRFHANSDTPAALAVLAVLVQGIVLIIYPDQLMEEDVSVYIPTAMLALLFTLYGKMMLTARIRRNFKYLTSGKEMYAMLSVYNKEFARELSRGLGPEVDEVAYHAPAGFITGFLSKSYTGDYSDNFYCVASPVGFLGALLIGGVTGFLSKNPVLAVSGFAATMCVCAPLSSAIVPHLMLGRMSKWLCKGGEGAMLAGYETAEELASVGAVLLDEKDIFPGESVQLHGMKVFAEKRIDEAILDAASVILSCNGLMSGVFLNMIGGNQRMLKKVDSIIYEDGMGISAWVDGKRVLIGGRELMQNHEVECPSRDFEARYTRGGRKVLYISNSGELSAMFVISYNGEVRTAERLAALERRGVSIILYTTDPNITSDLVSSVFGIRKGSVRVLPAKLHPEYNYLSRYRDHITAGCAHHGGIAGILQLLRASRSVCRSVRAGAITQLVGIIVGYGLVAILIFTGSLKLASFYALMLYGLGALAITFLVSNFGKM